MLTDIINFSKDELNSGIIVTKTITEKLLYYAEKPGSDLYKPTSIKINNTSGATAYFGLFTDGEYTHWLPDNTLSILFPVTNSTTEIVNSFKGLVTTIVASGVVGSPYTSGIVCTVIEEYA